VILSTGVLGALRVSPQAFALLRESGVTVHTLRTPAAVGLYNALAETEAVGALVHSTC
jgi:hypothetical protein